MQNERGHRGTVNAPSHKRPWRARAVEVEQLSCIDTQTARGFIEQARTGEDLAYQDEIELWLAAQLLLTAPTSLEILLEGGHSFRDGARSERFSRLARRALRELYIAIRKKHKRYSAGVGGSHLANKLKWLPLSSITAKSWTLPWSRCNHLKTYARRARTGRAILMRA